MMTLASIIGVAYIILILVRVIPGREENSAIGHA